VRRRRPKRHRPRPSPFAVLLFPLALAAGVAGASQITIRGDLNDTVFAKGKEHSVWTGNAVLDSEDTTIRADRIDLWGKDFIYADCQGNLSVANRKKDIYLTCDSVSYDRTTKFLVALGTVYMEDHKNGIVVKGDALQYDDARDETIVQIRVRIFGDKEELECRAEFARYLRGQDLLVLSGMPYVRWKGDEYRAVQITITLKDGKVQSVKMVEGTGTITSTDNKGSGDKAGSTAGTAAPAQPASEKPAPQSLAPQSETPPASQPPASQPETPRAPGAGGGGGT
jgi:lipopolysaccharide export system protein LptA